jgi:integrase
MHTLRHKAASLMVAGGRPIFDVAKILGHQDVKITMRYAHFAPEAGRDTIDTLGEMLGLSRGIRDSDRIREG